MGVAYGAQLYLGMSPSFPTQFATLFDEYTRNGVTVSSNSYGIPVKAGDWRPVMTSKSGGLEVTAKNALAYRGANNITSAEMMSRIIGEEDTTTTPDQWLAEVASIRAFQNGGGGVVWANSNYGQNTIDAGTPDAPGLGPDNSDLGWIASGLTAGRVRTTLAASPAARLGGWRGCNPLPIAAGRRVSCRTRSSTWAAPS